MITDLRIQNIITTDRLNLEILTIGDYDFIKDLVNSSGWLENIGDRNIHSKNDAITYIDKILKTENFHYWVVRIKDTKTPIGIITFLKRTYLAGFDLGFAFLPEFSNNGFAHEAAKAVLLMLSGVPEFDKILATTLNSNKNSIKLLTKLGFSFEKEIEIDNAKLHVYTNKVYQPL